MSEPYIHVAIIIDEKGGTSQVIDQSKHDWREWVDCSTDQVIETKIRVKNLKELIK